ncbi:hypothetical protein STEG23_025203, partial [Scotinomys teguina]
HNTDSASFWINFSNVNIKISSRPDHPIPALIKRFLVNSVVFGDFSSQEDKNLWIASRLIWFDQPRAPEKFFRCSNIQISFKASGSKDEASQTAPVKIGPSS